MTGETASAKPFLNLHVPQRRRDTEKKIPFVWLCGLWGSVARLSENRGDWAALVIVLFALVVVTARAIQVPQVPADPFAFFQPSAALTPSDRQRLERGDVVVRILPARDGQLAVFAAAALDSTPDTLIERIQAIEQLKKSPFVPIVKRFSDPPIIEDFAGLTLDEGELEDLRRCRPGDCGLKLSAAEIEHVRRAASEAGTAWKDALGGVFGSWKRAIIEGRIERETGDIFRELRRRIESRS